MKIKVIRKRCRYCRPWFTAHPRLKERQIACFNKECQNKEKKDSQKRWLAKNPNHFKTWYNDYLKEWLSKHPCYLKKYRKNKDKVRPMIYKNR